MTSVPALRDPAWDDVALPVRGFLRERPRPWAAINAWAEERGLRGDHVRHALAVLDFRGLARWNAKTQTWRAA